MRHGFMDEAYPAGDLKGRGGQKSGLALGDFGAVFVVAMLA